MTRSLYGWKPPSTATDYLKEQDFREAAERVAVARDSRMQKSRDWLASYQRQTRFNWSGRFAPVTITKEIDHEEAEAAYHQIGQAALATQERAAEGVGDTPGEEGDPGRAVHL